MAPANTGEKSPAQTFVDAITYLEDITTIHTDPNLASMRAKLMRSSSDGVVAYDMVRTMEVLGIANTVTARFRSTPHHCTRATHAAFAAGMLWGGARHWLADRNACAGTPALGESDDGYRTFLLTKLDWVHKYSTVRDGASAGVNTCLCPVTAYLQLILRETPTEDWDVATAEPDSSPLAFAWAWARTSPGIGKPTADVVTLVTMGRCVHRLIADEAVRAEKAAARSRTKVLGEGVLGAVKDYLTEAVMRVRGLPPAVPNYKRVPEPGDAEELRMIVQKAAEKLREEGERYAQLLGEKDAAQEREAIVVSIRTLAGFILGKAEPPVPEKVLLAIADRGG